MPFVEREYIVEEPIPAFLFLMRKLGVRQGEAQKIVATGRLIVNDERPKHDGQKIVGFIKVKIFEPAPQGREPIFECPDFAFFDKPSGVLVHPTTYRTPYSMLDEIRYLYGPYANAVHRIDMETSGLLLAAKNKGAEKRLKTLFESRGVQKRYLAWVRGRIDTPFEVNAPLKINNDFSTIKLKMLVHPDGKPAVTRFAPIEYDPIHDATLISAQPLTGRQHQIRVHLFHVKHPIIGDPIYGVPTEVAIRYLDKELSEKERRFYMGGTRLMLHAQTLFFKDNGVFYHIESRYDFEGEKSTITPPTDRAAPVFI